MTIAANAHYMFVPWICGHRFGSVAATICAYPVSTVFEFKQTVDTELTCQYRSVVVLLLPPSVLWLMIIIHHYRSGSILPFLWNRSSSPPKLPLLRLRTLYHKGSLCCCLVSGFVHLILCFPTRITQLLMIQGYIDICNTDFSCTLMSLLPTRGGSTNSPQWLKNVLQGFSCSSWLSTVVRLMILVLGMWTSRASKCDTYAAPTTNHYLSDAALSQPFRLPLLWSRVLRSPSLFLSLYLASLCLFLGTSRAAASCASLSSFLRLTAQVDESQWLFPHLLCCPCCRCASQDVALGYRQSGGVWLPHLTASLCCIVNLLSRDLGGEPPPGLGQESVFAFEAPLGFDPQRRLLFLHLCGVFQELGLTWKWFCRQWMFVFQGYLFDRLWTLISHSRYRKCCQLWMIKLWGRSQPCSKGDLE